MKTRHSGRPENIEMARVDDIPDSWFEIIIARKSWTVRLRYCL